jgi:hypothetical protein
MNFSFCKDEQDGRRQPPQTPADDEDVARRKINLKEFNL